MDTTAAMVHSIYVLPLPPFSLPLSFSPSLSLPKAMEGAVAIVSAKDIPHKGYNDVGLGLV